MKKEYKKITKCRICNSSDLHDFLSLGNIPIPNGFLTKKQLQKKEKRYPLDVIFCQTCGLVQLRFIVDPKVMFQNYLYIPSSSSTRLNHFKTLAASSKKRFALSEKSLVVDIGSNDGSLLQQYKLLGLQILGVDPAKNLVTIAKLNGVPTLLGFMNPSIARKITKKHQKASLVLATNVMAHIGDLKTFFASLEILLDEKGVFISQFPYLLDLLNKNQFDTIYHEHLFYFSLKPLLHLAKDSGLEIFDVVRSDLDGGSIQVFWKKKTNTALTVNSEYIQEMLEAEKKAGLHSLTRYKEFASKVTELKKTMRTQLSQMKKQHKKIVGYGAAAKGNILLNFFDIDASVIDYVVDSTPYKQGLYTPGTHIPIFDESRIFEDFPDYIIILAWNFKEEIIEKNKKYYKAGGKFIVPIPTFTVM